MNNKIDVNNFIIIIVYSKHLQKKKTNKKKKKYASLFSSPFKLLHFLSVSCHNFHSTAYETKVGPTWPKNYWDVATVEGAVPVQINVSLSQNRHLIKVRESSSFHETSSTTIPSILYLHKYSILRCKYQYINWWFDAREVLI